MPTYISHITWTEQGIRSVKDSPKRLDAVKKQLKTLGGELKAFYMTQGTYDALLIFEVPNDTVLAKLLLQVGSAGNVRIEFRVRVGARRGWCVQSARSLPRGRQPVRSSCAETVHNAATCTRQS